MPESSPPGDGAQGRFNRAALLERLSRETFDIAVIGGGITGAGIARDAALRGLSVALVDKGDFASGTSSRSSRLVHGGLRYLRYRQFGLVREALRERGLLLRLAPHLVRPIPFLLPVYEGSHDRPLALRLALAGYDLLAGTLGIGRHSALSREALLREAPRLRDRGLRTGLRYFDAVTDDARLTLAVALSAVRQGAVALNYVEAVGLESTSGRISGVHYRDLVSGEEGVARAQVVVSAAGPWTDQVRSLAGLPRLLRPTKGIHVVVPASRLPVAAVVAFARGDRMLFAIPRGDHTYIGTTDTDFAGEPGSVEADRDDVAYVLDATNATFDAGLSMSDVLATWAGVRPLLREEGTPSELSRDYDILDGPPGLYTICGGKLTTYRPMAERLLNRVIEREGGRFSARPAPCCTAREPLPGGATGDIARYEREAGAALQEGWDISEDAARRLVGIYGAEHVRVLACAARLDGGGRGGSPAALKNMEELLQPLAPGCPVLTVEVIYAAREEMAVTLEDFLRRRSDLTLFGRDGAEALADEAARLMARALDWSATETRQQVDAYRQAVARMTAFRSEAGGSAEDTAR